VCSVSDRIVIDRWFVDYIISRHHQQHHYYHQFITAAETAGAGRPRSVAAGAVPITDAAVSQTINLAPRGQASELRLASLGAVWHLSLIPGQKRLDR